MCHLRDRRVRTLLPHKCRVPPFSFPFVKNCPSEVAIPLGAALGYTLSFRTTPITQDDLSALPNTNAEGQRLATQVLQSLPLPLKASKFQF